MASHELKYIVFGIVHAGSYYWMQILFKNEVPSFGGEGSPLFTDVNTHGEKKNITTTNMIKNLELNKTVSTLRN